MILVARSSKSFSVAVLSAAATVAGAAALLALSASQQQVEAAGAASFLDFDFDFEQTRIDRESLDLFSDVTGTTGSGSRTTTLGGGGDGDDDDGIDLDSLFVQLDLSKMQRHAHQATNASSTDANGNRNLQFQQHGSSGWSSLRVKIDPSESVDSDADVDADIDAHQRQLMDMLMKELNGMDTDDNDLLDGDDMSAGVEADGPDASNTSNDQQPRTLRNNWRGVRKGVGNDVGRSVQESMTDLETRSSGKKKGSGKKKACSGSGKKGKKKGGDDDDDDECGDNGVDAQCSILTDSICVAFPGHDMDQSTPVRCDRLPVGTCEASIQYIVAVFNPFVSDMPSSSPSVEPSASAAPSTSSGKKGSGKKGKGKTNMPVTPSFAPSAQPTASSAPSSSSGKKKGGKKGKKKGKDKGTDAPEHPEGTIVINNFLEMFSRFGNSPSCTTEFDKIELPEDMDIAIQPGEVFFLLSSEYKINLCECPSFHYDLVTIASPKGGGTHCFDVIDTSLMVPTLEPSQRPSTEPSGSPSASPSNVPSASPSAGPSSVPSSAPSSVPSLSQRPSGSAAPSPGPSLSLAPSLSEVPSLTPSTGPTSSEVPSSSPSSTPSSPFPSSNPTLSPSSVPSVAPSLSMAPTTCTSESGNFQVIAQFDLKLTNNYTNWFYELWSRPNTPGAPWELETRKPAFFTDNDAIFCINSPPPGRQYLVQTINTVDGMIGPFMNNTESAASAINMGTAPADNPTMPFNDGAFSPSAFVPPVTGAPPNPVMFPGGEFGFGPAVDLALGAVCQIGFTPGVVGSGCGFCRYSSLNGPFQEKFNALSQNPDFSVVPPCPETNEGLPIVPVPPMIPLVPPMIP